MFVGGGKVTPCMVREFGGVETTWGEREFKAPRGPRKFSDWEGEGMGDGPGKERDGSGTAPVRFGVWGMCGRCLMGTWFAKELLLALLTAGGGIAWPEYTGASPRPWVRRRNIIKDPWLLRFYLPLSDLCVCVAVVGPVSALRGSYYQMKTDLPACRSNIHLGGS